MWHRRDVGRGGIGSIAIGVGGLDVAVAMGGGAFYLKTPKIMGIKLTGNLQPYVTAKEMEEAISQRSTGMQPDMQFEERDIR